MSCHGPILFLLIGQGDRVETFQFHCRGIQLVFFSVPFPIVSVLSFRDSRWNSLYCIGLSQSLNPDPQYLQSVLCQPVFGHCVNFKWQHLLKLGFSGSELMLAEYDR